ncbi:MAG: NAD-dependent epimerase/dehydratase family protein [Promethearchaeota archaeon]
MNQSKTALVTGALGHTGTFMVGLLRQNGWKVVATDLPARERGELLTKEKIFLNRGYNRNFWDEGINLIHADLTNKDSLVPLFEKRKFDAIFHTASLYDYFAPFSLLKKINVGGLRNLLQVYLEYCRNQFQDVADYPRFIHWSTCGVYGQPEYKHFDIPANENAPFNPPNDYSKSKMLQELLLKKFQDEQGIPVVIIRPGPIYGPGQKYGAFHVYRAFSKVKFVPIVQILPREKRLRMPMVHVEDLVRAALYLAEAPPSKVVGEAFNVLDDCGYQETLNVILARLFKLKTVKLNVPWFLYKIIGRFAFFILNKHAERCRTKGIRPKVDGPMAEYVVHQYYFSNEKIKNLGFTFKYPNMLPGTKQTLQWYLESGWIKKEVNPLSIIL